MSRPDIHDYLVAWFAEDRFLGVRRHVEGEMTVLDGRAWLLAGKEIPRFSQAQPRKALKKTE